LLIAEHTKLARREIHHVDEANEVHAVLVEAVAKRRVWPKRPKK
jgi:hypothetical protein